MSSCFAVENGAVKFCFELNLSIFFPTVSATCGKVERVQLAMACLLSGRSLAVFVGNQMLWSFF